LLRRVVVRVSAVVVKSAGGGAKIVVVEVRDLGLELVLTMRSPLERSLDEDFFNKDEEQFREGFLLEDEDTAGEIGNPPKVSLAIKFFKPIVWISSSTVLKFSSLNCVKHLRKNLLHNV